MPQPAHRQLIESSRIRLLNQKKMSNGDYVLYWMQQSQRAEGNHALEYAVELANHLDRPLLVAFGLTDTYPEANLRHYRFMLEGLHETAATLAQRGIRLSLQLGSPPDVALNLGQRAAVIVCDCGYLRFQKAWRQGVARKAVCRVVQVEADVVVPVAVVSRKAEYAARTLRPKLHRHLFEYLTELPDLALKNGSLGLNLKNSAPNLNLEDIDELLLRLDLDRSVEPVNSFFKGGTREAKKRFKKFLNQSLKHYPDHHNQPQTDDISHMSPYLHFGQISPLYLALRAKAAEGRLGGPAAVAAFIEQLIVRRELAVNFVNFTPNYDTYDCLPGWASQTLSDHRSDKRPHRYSRTQLENAETHDPYWNAAMQEMKHTGFMHTYMRMYWGKKILEWSRTPQQAFYTTLALNNKYFLDGRDPNSYTGVAWIYGVHDRPWPERPIFGKTRFMAASGLERKCDINAYVKKVGETKRKY
ncbi:MAG: deoxyribodipyrimidine photo-lyase [Desulfobacterales bacterium]|jgi:deoxyribodipyrimidine photo-lyase